MISNFLKPYAGWFNFSFRLFDAVLVFFAGLFAFFAKFSLITPPLIYQEVLLFSALLSALIFHWSGIYRPFRGQPFWTHFKRLVLGWVSLALVLSALVFLTKKGSSFSREWFFDWMVLGFFLSLVSHAALWGGLKFLRSKGFNIRRVVLIGSRELVTQVCEKLSHEKSMGYEVIQMWEVSQIPENFEAWWSVNHPDEIWMVVSLAELAGLQDRLTLFRFSTANIRIIPDLSGLNLLNYSMGQLQGMPVLTLRSTPMQGMNRVIKSVEDKVISGLIVLMISPVLLAIALAVKLSSPGPIFYRQDRVSLNNKPFQMLKFRSMPVDAESTTGAVWAKPGETRATKVGAFLRKTSLDELPQFLNVLKGDMSIVGPRPERPMLIEKFKQEIPGYMQKHMVKAGITGWAQINGWRGNTDLKKRIEYDLYYIEHWSLWFDLKIIFLTLFKGFVNKNAY